MPIATKWETTVTCDICGAISTARDFPEDWWGAAKGSGGQLTVIYGAQIIDANSLVLCPICAAPILEQAAKRKGAEKAA